MKGMHSVKFALLAATAIAFSPAPAAWAADAGSENADNGEIIVTAQRREEKQVDVPITVTTLNQDQMETANVQSLVGISKVTPALRFDNQAGWVQPSIRGVGTAVTSSGVGSNVGIYVDGFYQQNSLAADFDLLRVKNVQVLKGPQGTLFGRNTTGGAILVQTADPSEEAAFEGKVGYGRFNSVKAQAYATAGLAHGLAFDVEGSYRRGDGFQTDLNTKNNKVGRYENWSVRTGLKAELSSDVSILLRYEHQNVNDPTAVLGVAFNDPQLGFTGPAAGLLLAAPGISTTTNRDGFVGSVVPFERNKNDIYKATVKADIGFANFTSYTQYRYDNSDMDQNLDRSNAGIFEGGFITKDKTFSQEFLLTSKPGPKLQWTVGAFYFSNVDTWRFYIDNFYPTRILYTGSGTTTRTAAAYADLTYEVTPKLFITAGARISHDQIDDGYWLSHPTDPVPLAVNKVSQANADKVKGDKVTPRVVIRYKPTDQSSIYASYNRGYKAGMLDVGGSTGNAVSPETIDAFEVGYKYDDRRISVALSGFYYDYKNLQVSLFTNGSARILNAANSQIYGLEAQFSAHVGDHLDINAGATWTHARYKTFNEAPVYVRCTDPAYAGLFGCLFPAPTQPYPPFPDRSSITGTTFFNPPGLVQRDTTMQHTPEFTGNISARYHTELAGGEFALSGNLYYTSSFFFSPSGTQFPQDAYAVLSARAQWTDPSKHYTVALYGDNLTNQRYKTQVQYNNFSMGAIYAAPVTYGLELGVKF